MRRLAIVVLAGLAVPFSAQDLELTVDTEVSDTGFYSLSWTGADRMVTLQEATTADFSDADTIYEGVDEATVISGKLDGTYYYRIRAGEGPWGEPLEVTVRHHSLAQAFSFLALGAVVFLATAALIISGHRRHRRETAHLREVEAP